MGLKTNKCCCCGPCEVATGTCCPCTCRNLCVTLSSDDYACACNENSVHVVYDETIGGWEGSVGCGGVAVPFLIQFERIDGQCYLVVQSECLGFGEGYEHRIPITASSCRSIDETIDVDLSGCSPHDTDCATGTLRIHCAEVITPDCCDCLCKCLCIQFSTMPPPGQALGGGDQVFACTSDGIHWSGSLEFETVGDVIQEIDVTVELQTGPYGGCIFHVEIVSADLGIDEEHDVEIDCDSLNVTILGTYSNGDHWTLFLSCAWCNECEAALVHCCGEARQMPRVLTATINGEGDCPQGTGTLTYNEDCAFWEGSAVLTNGEILAMLFRCNGDPAIGPVESNLAVNQCIAPPADPWSGNYPCACENQFGFCGLAATPPVEALCDPVYVRFNLGILLNASCCNTVDPGSGLFIEITE